MIGPGDIVECIDASPYKGKPIELVAGQRYVIEAVWDYLPHQGDPNSTWFDCAVDLVGVEGPEPLIAWGLYRFKPLDSSLDEQLARHRQNVPA